MKSKSRITKWCGINYFKNFLREKKKKVWNLYLLLLSLLELLKLNRGSSALLSLLKLHQEAFHPSSHVQQDSNTFTFKHQRKSSNKFEWSYNKCSATSQLTFIYVWDHYHTDHAKVKKKQKSNIITGSPQISLSVPHITIVNSSYFEK